MRPAFQRAPLEDFAPRAPERKPRGFRDWRPRVQVRAAARRHFVLALLATTAALGLEQATAVAAGSSAFQAVPASHSTGAPAHLSQSVPSSVTVPPAPTTTAPPATTLPPTTVARRLAATTQPKPVSTTTHTAAAPSDYGCGPALAYLAGHAAPGFHFECPGYSLGHQAMTCINVAGVCSGEKLIVITVPCKAAYMNEASNSWSMQGLSNAPIDPFGYCH